MRRGALIDEIQRLERAHLGDESGARGEAEARAAKMDRAIERLEMVALSLEKQLLTIDGVGEFSAADEVLFAEERKTLNARIDRLRDKIEKLQISRPLVEAPRTLGRPKGTARALRQRLVELVTQLRADPHVARAEIRPFQLRVVELVRERRRTLDGASERLVDARSYLLHSAQRLEGLMESARVVAAEPHDGADSAALSERGADPGQPSESPAPARPVALFVGDRAAISTRVEMAHLAVEDARDAVRTLAHDWPELAPLADRQDWQKMPFGAVRAALSSQHFAPELTGADIARRFEETKRLCEALALWVDELRRAVSHAPPPTVEE